MEIHQANDMKTSKETFRGRGVGENSPKGMDEGLEIRSKRGHNHYKDKTKKGTATYANI